MPPKNQRSRRTKRQSAPVDRELVNSVKATGANTTTVASDLIDRRQNMNLVQTPPKQLGNQIYWLKEIIISTVTTSTTTYVESNVSFTLAMFNDYSSLTSVFDQYCIYSAAVSYSIDGNSPVGVSASVLTALDYDNNANIGPVGIAGYNNCSETLLGPSTSLVRYVKPCLALAAYTTSFTGYATTRCWLNSNSPSIQHYGVRFIALQTNATFPIRVTIELVAGFRNKW
jgi:hypothetical protein